jgi:hypothetical protein
MRPKALGRDDPEGTADAKREPKASDVKSTGVFWRESIIVDDINNNKSWWWVRCRVLQWIRPYNSGYKGSKSH